MLAEQRLVQYKNALEATGWIAGKSNEKAEGY
jgi:hypothetical protein